MAVPVRTHSIVLNASAMILALVGNDVKYQSMNVFLHLAKMAEFARIESKDSPVIAMVQVSLATHVKIVSTIANLIHARTEEFVKIL